ncbi:MAG: SAM-dependent methyltransferase [Gemmatirosa sp.]
MTTAAIVRHPAPLLLLLAMACSGGSATPNSRPDSAPAARIDGDTTAAADSITPRGPRGAAPTRFPTPSRPVSDIVAPGGTVWAEDIEADYLRLLQRRLRANPQPNVVLTLGEPHDPRLPRDAIDVALLIHMYHEIEQPFGLLYNLWPSLRPGARVGILDTTRPTNQHGTPPALLRCELEAMGYTQRSFHQTAPDEYLAVFAAPENEAALTAPDRVAGRLDALGCGRIASRTAEGGA